MRRIVRFGLACAIALVSCKGQALAPRFTLPAPIRHAEAPEGYRSSDYFLYGWDEDEGLEPIFADLLARGIPLESAWIEDHRFPGNCTRLCLSSLLVRLDRPDPRMRRLGYTQDPRGFGCCNPFWLEYRFGSSW